MFDVTTYAFTVQVGFGFLGRPRALSRALLLARALRFAARSRPGTARTAGPRPSTAWAAGDVLEVVVLGNEDLSRTPTVQTGGTVTLPLLGEVEVAGLTVPEIKEKLTELLGRDYLVRPQVEVTVKEYQSQFVTVLGEVVSPGRKPLRGRTRLVDVLVDAGGFSPRASGEVTVTRAGRHVRGRHQDAHAALRVGLAHRGGAGGLETTLRHGDIVSACPSTT